MDQEAEVKGLAFDEEKHEYAYQGVPIPGCTRIIAGLQDWTGVPVDAMEYKSQIGREVHRLTAEIDRLGFDVAIGEKTIDPELIGYLYAWEAFKEDTAFSPTAIERMVFSKRHLCAGILDRLGCCMQKIHPGEELVVDIKCVSQLGPHVGVQLAGYSTMVNEKRKKADHVKFRYAVQLQPDGLYRVQPYEDPSDQASFLAALTIHNWRLQHERHYRSAEYQ